jgi:hypothetical protein
MTGSLKMLLAETSGMNKKYLIVFLAQAKRNCEAGLKNYEIFG